MLNALPARKASRVMSAIAATIHGSEATGAVVRTAVSVLGAPAIAFPQL